MVTLEERKFLNFLTRLRTGQFVWKGISEYETMFLVTKKLIIDVTVSSIPKELNRCYTDTIRTKVLLNKYALTPKVLVHNHPKGTLQPSSMDYVFAQIFTKTTGRKVLFAIVTPDFKGCIFNTKEIVRIYG